MATERSRIAVYDAESDAERGYWLERLSRERGLSNLVLDYKRPRTHNPRRETLEVAVADETLRRLLALTKESSFLIYTALLTMLKICLHKYTGSTSIVVGAPPRVKNPDKPVRANALAIVNSVESHLSVRELMLQVRETLIEAYGKQNYPYESLIRHLGLDKIENRGPLFDVALSLINIHGPLAETRHDLTITFEQGEGLVGTVAFNPDLFTRKSVEHFMSHFLRVLDQCLADSNTTVAGVQLITKAERDQLLSQETETPVPVDTVMQLFEQQVARAPQAIAAVVEDQELTYEQLNRRANQLAAYLRAGGVQPEHLVAICVERSLDMLVGILGVLKAGAGYVPLDPEYPKERLAFILDDTAAKLLITQERLRDRLPQHAAQVIYLDSHDLENEAGSDESTGAPGNLAYVIYTSGSTGTPKGVMIQQRALAARALALSRNYNIKPGERLLQFVSISFDAMAEEVFPTLTSGATVVLHRNPTGIPPLQLLRDCEQLGVTMLHIPPSYWQPLIDDLLASGEPVPAWIKLFITGGERISLERLAGWIGRTRQPHRIVNAYGPTEATITATIHEVPVTGIALERLATLPIGRPIENTPVYLLDPYMQLVPAGVPGEMYIGGLALARGYLNDAATTAARFIPDPFSRKPGARLYRTGDRARYLPDGNIEFLDRVDNQIKIRGFRVEPGEIEARLTLHPAVGSAVVVAWEPTPGEKMLVAYTVSRNGRHAPASDLRRFLSEQLPNYMVPGLFVSLDQWPLTTTGKVDRHALPPPVTSVEEPSADNERPRTQVEQVLAGIYAEILKVKNVGRRQGFFELGGHSLLATQVVSRVREVFQIELPVRSIFDSPEVDQLARTIETARQSSRGIDSSPIMPAPRNADLPLSFAQQRLWFLQQLDPSSPSYNFPIALKLKGRLDVTALEQTLAEIVARHESLRTTFPAVDGEPVQLIHPPTPPTITRIDVDDESSIQELIVAHAKQPFDLATGPLLRVVLFRLSDDEHVLLATMHHIVTDGWSLEVLIKETSALYSAFINSQPSPLPPLAIQYADFASWQHQWLQSDALSKQLDYWKQALASAPLALRLPADLPRAPQSNRGTTYAFALPAELSERIKEVSQAENVTLFMFLLAAFKLLLHSYTGQDNIVVGTNSANRNRSEVESLIGVFINDLALCTDLTGLDNFCQLLQRVREVTLGAYDHQEAPFEKVLEALRLDQQSTALRLFQVFFVLQNIPLSSFTLPELTLTPLEIESKTAKFDMGLYMIESGARIEGVMEYSTDLFYESTIARTLADFQELLEAVVANPDESIETLVALVEKDAVSVGDFNADLELD